MGYGDPINVTLPGDGDSNWGEAELNDVLQAIIDRLQTRVAAGDIDIQTALTVNGQEVSDLGGISFRNGATDGTARRVYFRSNELHIVDGSGNDIQLTLNGGINYQGSGSITGLAGSGASANYDALTKVFTWLDQTGAGAGSEVGTLRLRKPGTSLVCRVSASDAQASDYGVMMPSGTIAVGTGVVTMTSAGQIGVSKDLTFNTVQVSGLTQLQGGAQVTGTLRVAAGAGFFNSGSYGFTQRRTSFAPSMDQSIVGVHALSGSYVKFNAGGGLWTMKLPPVPNGDRLTSVQFLYSKGSGAALTGSVYRIDVTGSAQLVVASGPADTSTGPAVQALNTLIGGQHSTGSDGQHYEIRFSSDTSATLVGTVTIVFDHPEGL